MKTTSLMQNHRQALVPFTYLLDEEVKENEVMFFQFYRHMKEFQTFWIFFQIWLPNALTGWEIPKAVTEKSSFLVLWTKIVSIIEKKIRPKFDELMTGLSLTRVTSGLKFLLKKTGISVPIMEQRNNKINSQRVQ